MIIKRLRLENIRSYKAAEVEFPLGRTLFEGDIGSGKSTILMAVEFALFGLGGARASSLLRMGESEGRVELEFEAGGAQYSVLRVLARKGSSIQQAEGRLRGPEGEEDYPPTEMKERILAILNFREPTDPKSRSLIYQYAIYTPQEEMKQILSLRPDIRLQILRRAFGVDEYKLAAENAKGLLREMHERKIEFESAAKEIPALRKGIEELEKRAEKSEGELDKLTESEREQQEALEKLEKEKAGLHELEVQLGSATSDKAHLARETDTLRSEAEELGSELRMLGKKIERLSSGARISAGAPVGKEVDELKASVEALRLDIVRHEASEAEMSTKVGQFESVAREGRCPVCDREAGPEEFVGKLEAISKERRQNAAHLEMLRKDLQELVEALDRRRDYEVLLAQATRDRALAEEYQEESERKKGRLGTLRTDLGESEKRLRGVEGRMRILQAETRGLEQLQRKIDTARDGLVEKREAIAGLRRDVKNWREEARRTGQIVAGKEKSAAKAMGLGEREIWLGEYFIPTLESIERHLMTVINREFGTNFQNWFGMLVEDGEKEARVDEEFTPFVDQEGYEQDIEFLSGGERTSVALAYRLALSQMVQKSAETGSSSLILDEPTDGFSKGQLGKLREILDEMAHPQVVIVSHETELESMADQIYRVTKVDGESQIAR